MASIKVEGPYAPLDYGSSVLFWRAGVKVPGSVCGFREIEAKDQAGMVTRTVMVLVEDEKGTATEVQIDELVKIE